MENKIKTGVYKATLGEFKGAAIFVIDVSDDEEFVESVVSIFNPDTADLHELSFEEWYEISEADGLAWQQEIPVEVKDAFLNRSSHAHLKGLT